MLDIGYVKPIEDEEEIVDIVLSSMNINWRNLWYPEPVRTGLIFTKTYSNVFVTCIRDVHYGIFDMYTPECMCCKLTKTQVDKIRKKIRMCDDCIIYSEPWSEAESRTVYGAR